MNQHFELLFYYLNSVRRYPWTTFLTAAAVMLMGWTMVALMSNSYKSNATLYVAKKSVKAPLLKGLAADNRATDAIGNLMQHTLLSRGTLLSILGKSDLGFKIKNDKAREAIVRYLMKEVHITGDPKTSIYSITYFDGNPERARRVVAAITDRFVKDSNRGTIKDSAAVEKFLAKEKERYWKLLSRERKKLEAFREQNRKLLPSTGESYYSELDSWRTELSKAELELNESMRRLEALEAQKSSNATRGGQHGGITINEELARLERKLASIQLKYTEFHPDAVALSDEIRMLRKRKARLGGGYQIVPGPDGRRSNRTKLLQNLGVALAKAQGDVSALQVRVQSYRDIVDDLEAKVSVVPKVESELAVIEQRYEGLQKTYDDIVRRYEGALITNQVDKNQDIQNVKVIEAPAVSPLPVAPNRLKLIVLVWVLGILAGVAVSVFRSRQKQVVGTIKELRRLTEQPILGAVSLYESKEVAVRNRAQRLWLISSWVMLGALFLGLAFLFRHMG